MLFSLINRDRLAFMFAPLVEAAHGCKLTFIRLTIQQILVDHPVTDAHFRFIGLTVKQSGS